MTETVDAFLVEMGFQGSAPRVSHRHGRGHLCRLFRELGYRRGAEIGVWAGEFSEVLCQSVPGLQLTCVDPWQAYDTYKEKKNNQRRLDEAYRDARARLKRFDCTLLRMPSLEAAKTIPDGSLDFAYIDSNHAYRFVLEDLEAWTPKVRSGGILAGHDYEIGKTSPWIEVKAAVDDYTQAHGIAPLFVIADKSPSFWWVVP